LRRRPSAEKGGEMGAVKIFTKGQCPKCPAAKGMGDRLKMRGVEVIDYDLETIEGLAEAAFYGVMATPTIIVEGGEDNELAAWRGTVPSPQEIEEVLKANGFSPA
jgi:glutaredoxin